MLLNILGVLLPIEIDHFLVISRPLRLYFPSNLHLLLLVLKFITRSHCCFLYIGRTPPLM